MRELKDNAFRHKAAFGKRIEYYIIGLMLKKGLDCYIPMVDDDAIDIVVRRNDGSFVEVQVKALSKNNQSANVASFTALVHPQERKNYYFVFYSEYFDRYWVLSSYEFMSVCKTVQSGKNIYKKSIKFNCCKNGKGIILDSMEIYRDDDFKKIIGEKI